MMRLNIIHSGKIASSIDSKSLPRTFFSFDLSLFIFSDAFFDLTQMISGIGTLLAFLQNYSHLQATKPKNIRNFKKLLKSKNIKRTKDISG